MIKRKNHNKKQIGAFIISVVLFLSILFIMEKTGVPRKYAVILTAFYAIMLSVIPILRGATTSKEKFFFCDRSISASLNAFAITASVAFPVILMNGVALFFAKPNIFILFSVSIVVGMALVTLIIGRPLRQSGASNMSNFFEVRFNTKHLPKLLSIINLIGSTILFVIVIHSAAIIASWFFNLQNSITLLVVILASVMAASFGGLSSTTRHAGVAVICLLFAINIPLVLAAFNISSFPIGHLSFGSAALEPGFEIERQLEAAGLSSLGSSVAGLPNIVNWSNGHVIIAAICVSLGIVAMPTISQQFAASRITERASIAGERSLIIFGFLTLSIFALAAFAKIIFYGNILGLTSGEAGIEMPFLFEWGNNLPGIISVCQQISSTPEQLVEACNNNPNYILQFSDIQINGPFLLAVIGNIMDMPFAITAFIVVALLLVLISIASSNLFSLSSNLINAFYSQNLAHTTSLEILLTRLIILFVGFGAGLYLASFTLDYTTLFISAMGFFASSLLPSIIGAFLWNKTTSLAATASIACGSFVYAIHWLIASGTLNIVNVDQIDFMGIPAELGAIIALPISALVLIVVSITNSTEETCEQSAAFSKSIFQDEDEVAILKNRF